MCTLFFDIDGTLLDPKTRTIPKSAKEGLCQAKEKGHQIFINTGRTFCALPKEVRNLPFDGLLCGCGTYLLYKGTVLAEHPIPYKRGLEIIDHMQACSVEGQLEASHNLYFSKNPYRNQQLERARKELVLLGLRQNFSIETKDFFYDKLLVCSDSQSDLDSFFHHIEKDMKVIDYKNGFYECVQKAYSKATAIEFLREYLNLEPEQIYVFGDSGNDEDVFAYAGHTIAMGKHDKLLDPLTEYVTDTVEQDGIYKALKYYGLLG